MTLSRGRPGQLDEPSSHKMLDRFVELGGNFIDTADVYNEGTAERYLGTWLDKRKNRDSLVIASKCFLPVHGFDDPNRRGLSRKHISWSVEQSLKRLQTDYIDLYQIHVWDSATPIEETLRTMDDLVRSGKVRYVGASNVTGWQLQKIVYECKIMGLNPWVSLQAQYSLLCRHTEFELLDVCRNEGIGLLPWSPLRSGWLTGKIRRGMSQPPSGTRIAYVETDRAKLESESHVSFSRFAEDDKALNLLDVMDRIGKEKDKSISQVALRWLLQQDTVPSVIIGAKTLQQLDENMGAGNGWELNDKEMKELDDASEVEEPYPYNMVNLRNKKRVRHNFCK
ncbi:1-deoxyxylulose-5-phosphate synthase YajO-like [Glandiceps talaboti]